MFLADTDVQTFQNKLLSDQLISVIPEVMDK